MTRRDTRADREETKRIQIALICRRCFSTRFTWETLAMGCHHCGHKDLRIDRYYVGEDRKHKKPYKLRGLLIIWDECGV